MGPDFICLELWLVKRENVDIRLNVLAVEGQGEQANLSYILEVTAQGNEVTFVNNPALLERNEE